MTKSALLPSRCAGSTRLCQTQRTPSRFSRRLRASTDQDRVEQVDVNGRKPFSCETVPLLAPDEARAQTANLSPTKRAALITCVKGDIAETGLRGWTQESVREPCI
jgi:hypothetical protein